jgi:very-short-patch-repair endonuclease
VCSIDRAAEREEAWGLVRDQHGVVSRRQLLDLGLSRRAIEHRLARGRLHLVANGVYAVGRPGVTRHGQWMAAVLSCGPGAMLSHGSAAALWGIGREHRGIEISVRVASPRRRSGLRVYRRPTLADRDVTSRDGIPITGLVQTLVDLAATLPSRAVERLINEADRLDLIEPPALRRELESHRCEPGVRPLRLLLDKRTFRLTDSELEQRFLRLVEKADLPFPLTGQYVNGFKVDFFWPDLGLVVETDGLRYHRTPAQQARDHTRDQAHLAAGLTPLRFTHAQVRYESGYVRATLLAVVPRLRRKEDA